MTQNVFLKLYMKRDSLRNHPNIQGWLFLTLRNQIMNETQRPFYKREVELVPENAPAVELEYAPDFNDSLPDGLSQDERLFLRRG